MAPKIKTCREVGLRLQTYLDGELDEASMEQIRVHLEACVHCGLEFDEFRKIKDGLSALRPTADADAIERLKEFSARIANES